MKIMLDVPLRINEICRVLNSKLPDNISTTAEISSICTDTRECDRGDLFIALSGKSDSGENYTNDALSKGCTVISSSGRNAFIYTEDTAAALMKIATLYKETIAPRYTVAVTGSVGKSTTVKFLSSILKEKYRVHSTIGNFNNHIGLPLTVLTMPRDTEVLVLEMGMNHIREISKLSRSMNPDMAIITNIGTAHIGNLGSRERIAEAKLEICEGMKSGRIILPYGEPLLSGIKSGLYVGRNTSLSDFSLNDNIGGSYSFNSIESKIEGIEFFDKREHLLCDLAIAISAAHMLMLSPEEIIRGVGAITSSNLRQRFIKMDDFTIFDDSYNASFESVVADLKYIHSFGKPTGAFIGDILELGDNAAAIHENIGHFAAELKTDHLYLYGEYAEHTSRGAISNGMSINQIYINKSLESPEVSISHIINNHSKNEIVLFKASHRLRLDKIADTIKSQERNSNENQ